MEIREVAAQSGLSADTIRFYEKSGMLPPIARDARGWRRFSPADLEWLTVLRHLRATGMPLGQMKRFAVSAHGPSAETPAAQSERLQLLKTHAARLAQQRAELDACAAYLNAKIRIYTDILEV